MPQLPTAGQDELPGVPGVRAVLAVQLAAEVGQAVQPAVLCVQRAAGWAAQLAARVEPQPAGAAQAERLRVVASADLTAVRDVLRLAATKPVSRQQKGVPAMLQRVVELAYRIVLTALPVGPIGFGVVESDWEQLALR